MAKKLQWLKLFFVLFISTAFIFSFTRFGVKAYEKWSVVNGKVSDGTTIGELGVSGKARTEASELLRKNYADWQTKVSKGTVLNTAVIALKEVPENLPIIIKQNPQIEIAEGTTFSLLDFAEKQQINDDEALNVLATGIYQAILPSNFTIVERNISQTLPNYAVLGYEARIDQIRGADLVFTNPNKFKYKLELQLEDNQLTVLLKGIKFLYDYQISFKEKQSLKPKTIVQYSPVLLAGNSEFASNGKPGQIVKVYRDIYQDNQLLKSELISEDYYPPVHQVEILGIEGTPSRTVPTNTAGSNNNQPTDSTTKDQPAGQTDAQQDTTNESDLWGKPNEQPK